MTQPTDVLAPAIGACLQCRALFLVTPGTPSCILCGCHPEYTLPFPTVPPGLAEEPKASMSDGEYLDKVAGLVPLSGEEAETVEPIPAAVPSTEPSPAAEESPPAAGEELAAEAGISVPSSILTLFRGIQEFMGGITEGIEPVRQLFVEAGAETEEAATAVGRLSAVRDFVEILWERLEPEPTEPVEPQPEPPAVEG